MSNSLAFVFPGQGSQSVGMLADIASEHALVAETFAEASSVLGIDLGELANAGPEQELNRTDITQPALLTASVALWRVWQDSSGAQPDWMAGHSLGEYSALVCAGSLKFSDAVRLVNLRGQFMQQAVPAGEGAMAAILGLDDAVIEDACAAVAQGDVVSAVNYNSPGQVVIAGQSAAVDRAIAACTEAGAKRAMRLAVSVPSHCALMRPAADRLATELEQIEVSMPGVPVVQNVSAGVPASVEELRRNLVEQLYRPVLWVDCVQFMMAQGVSRAIECGPGKVLSGLNKRINRDLQTGSLGDAAGLATALA